MKNRKLNIPFNLNEIYAIQAAWILNLKNNFFISEIYISSLFMYLIILLIHFYILFIANGLNPGVSVVRIV